MVDQRFIRAEFDEPRRSFVNLDSEWIAGLPSIEYRFALYPCNTNPTLYDGGLEKCWRDEEGHKHSEFHVFGQYESTTAFEDEVDTVITESEKIATEDNVDQLLVVIDMVKERAVPLGYEDEDVLELEGLFQHGPEDGYTLRDIGDSPRLHHHLECDDEYWYFHVAQVVDPQGQLLGYGVFVVHFPEIPPSASPEQAGNADKARVLLLDHLTSERDAKLAKRGFEAFMETERVDNPHYAYMNDTEVLEGTAINAEWDESAGTAVWQEYNGDQVRMFLDGEISYICQREKWQPRQESIVDQFFKEHPQPVWLDDQVRAMFDGQNGLDEDDDFSGELSIDDFEDGK